MILTSMIKLSCDCSIDKFEDSNLSSLVNYEHLEMLAEKNYKHQFYRSRENPKGQQIVDEFLDININYPCLFGTLPVGSDTQRRFYF